MTNKEFIEMLTERLAKQKELEKEFLAGLSTKSKEDKSEEQKEEKTE